MIYEGKISGKTVQLRCIEERDAEITYAMRSDPEKSKYIHAAQGTVEDQRDYIRRIRDKLGNLLFVIEDYDGNVIGMKGLYQYNPLERWIVSGQFVGCGTQIQNMEALYLSFDFAFRELRVDQIFMSVLENNTGMYEIQQKFGAEVFRKRYSEEFQCNSIDSVLTEKAYQQVRPQIKALIERFAQRKQGGKKNAAEI